MSPEFEDAIDWKYGGSESLKGIVTGSGRWLQQALFVYHELVKASANMRSAVEFMKSECEVMGRELQEVLGIVEMPPSPLPNDDDMMLVCYIRCFSSVFGYARATATISNSVLLHRTLPRSRGHPCFRPLWLLSVPFVCMPAVLLP